MATNDGGPAFPGGVTDTWIATPGGNMELASSYGFAPVAGMSKRELIATKAMAGMLAAGALNSPHDGSFVDYSLGHVDHIAKESVRMADALLRALEAK